MKRIVVAITGASGSLYGVRLLQVLLETGNEVHLTISPAATQVFAAELGLQIDPLQFNAEELLNSIPEDSQVRERTGKLYSHAYQDFSAGIASGSFLTDGMVICPCSMGTLSSIANGLSSNLIHRAADVHLKERRKLIVVPRETPLGSLQLGNMKTLSDAGAVILPAMPGFYHQPQSIMDLIDFVVTRICDQLEVSANLTKRWGNSAK
ncbi:UbiX family flavin prenyltransferase [Thalassoglobus polymorphus]|uniref:Flavin prenyltransferase UbiX n=1 Tax=Thalassoglobus polymorphus TaxID=2527994 RepID=A0A517QTC7_9PLAN|nr:flavin prenyltransferase UbiX [Thalassoglobus polymorphus]QDT34900.1 putative aromatic acid decarboxylase [Thalassoglobus polymorphus]